MTALFKTPKMPKAQPQVTPPDAAQAAMDEAARLRKRLGRNSNMILFGKRRGRGGSDDTSAAGLLGSRPGTTTPPAGGGGGGGGGGVGGGGGAGNGKPGQVAV